MIVLAIYDFMGRGHKSPRMSYYFSKPKSVTKMLNAEIKFVTEPNNYG